MALVEIEDEDEDEDDDEDDAVTGSYDAKTRDSHNAFLCTEIALPQKLTHYGTPAILMVVDPDGVLYLAQIYATNHNSGDFLGAFESG